MRWARRPVSDPFDYSYPVSTQGPGVSGMPEYGDVPMPMGWKRNAFTIKVSPEMADDIKGYHAVTQFLNDSMTRAFDKMENPWRYPDPSAFRRFGTFEPFPRLLKLEKLWREFKRWRYHLAGWVGDVAYKIDPDHDQWEREW